MRPHQAVRDAAHVLRHAALDAALEPSLRPAALRVAAVKLIGDRRELSQTSRSSAQQPRRAAADDITVSG